MQRDYIFITLKRIKFCDGWKRGLNHVWILGTCENIFIFLAKEQTGSFYAMIYADCKLVYTVIDPINVSVNIICKSKHSNPQVYDTLNCNPQA